MINECCDDYVGLGAGFPLFVGDFPIALKMDFLLMDF
jgi:hypothetical protein